MKIGIVLGTRPEIIKMAPVIEEIINNDMECILIHTGQHYDIEMSKQFFVDLNLKLPDYNIGIGSNTTLKQIGIILSKLDEILVKEEIDLVLVQGDTNAVLAGAIAANKLKIPVGHVEAGLRSFDKSMPEEINRIIADSCSQLFFVPTKETAIILQKEGINFENIHITGNTIVDACLRHKQLAVEKNNIDDLVQFDEYITLTMHRAENVDDPIRLKNIVKAITNLNENIIFPIHPHTKKSLIEHNLYEELNNKENIQITKPLGYLDFLYLIMNSKLILTDSGGLQEEAITLDIPCITLRYNTERPETITAGGNILAGTDYDEIKKNINKVLNDKTVYKKMQNAKNPYGNGNSSKYIVDIIKEAYDKNLLRNSEMNSIQDFKGFELIKIEENLTVKEYLEKYQGCIIEQIFNNNKSICIEPDINLNGKQILVKKFQIVN